MKVKGILFTILSAVIFGFTPALASITYGLGNNSLSMTFYRNFFAIPFLFLMLKYKKIPLKINLKEIKDIFILSLIGVVLTTALLYSSYSYIGIGVATTLHFLYPMFVALACMFIFKEQLDRGTIISLILALVGVAFFMDFKSSGNMIGAIMALVSGLTYGFYILWIDKRNLIKMNLYKLSFYVVTFSALEMLIGNIFGGYIELNLPIKAYILIILCSVLASVVGIVLFQIGISTIGSTSAAIFSLFEPITSVITGVIIFNENLNLAKLLGCIIIFISITYLAIKTEKKEETNIE